MDQYSHLATGSQWELLQTLTEPRDVYCCPGETLPISNAIHEARLRTQYHKCKHCPHRDDVSTFSAETRERIDEAQGELKKQPICREDGFRGILWNELTPAVLGRLAAAVCQDVWQNRTDSATAGSSNLLEVVVGHDGRATALQSVDAIVAAVGEQGVRVINIGEASSPCLQFAISQLGAAAGLHATAANSDRLSIGLDVFGPQGLPLSGESLLRIDQQTSLTLRCRRTAGGRTQFPARKAYLGSLWKHFQGLPPIRVLVSSGNDFAWSMLAEIERETEASFVSCSQPALWKQADSTQVEQMLAAESQTTEFDLVFLLGEDGQSCRFAERSGRLLTPGQVLRLLLIGKSTGKQVTALVGEECDGPEWTAPLERESVAIRRRQSLREHFARGMATSSAAVGVDRHQRFWLPNAEEIPSCDGLVTLGQVLKATSAAVRS